MKIHSLHQPPEPWLGEALERFEARFRYPLGEGMHFRISHGREYLPFFQAMGEAAVWVAERDGEVLGTLAAALRTLHIPGGERRRAAYLGDLKVTPGGCSGRVVATLARTATSELMAQGLRSAYAVVMGGTARTPVRYTGRLGVPMFEEAGEISILKIGTAVGQRAASGVRVVTAGEVDAVYELLSRACVHAEGGCPSVRSLMSPVALLGDGEQACGVVEDTRRGKRLWLDGDNEMLAAHLSRFAYANVEAGTVLVRGALKVAAEAGFPGLFVAIPSGDAQDFGARMNDLNVHVAAAQVYGHGLPSTGRWSVDTSEI